MEELLGKTATLTKSDGFVLRGVVKEITDAGILFETEQRISFLNWNNIKSIVVL